MKISYRQPWFLGLLLLLLPSVSWAAEPSVVNFLSYLAETGLLSAEKTALGFFQKLGDLFTGLMTMLISLRAAWLGIQFMIAERDDYWPKFIEAMLQLAVVLGLWANYEQIIHGLTSIVDIYQSYLFEEDLLGSNGPVASGISTILISIGSAWANIELQMNFALTILQIAAAALVTIFLALGLGTFLGVYIVSKLYFIIGIAAGPIMIPLLMLPPTQDYFWSWVNFMLYSMFFQLVTIIMLILGTVIIRQAFESMSGGALTITAAMVAAAYGMILFWMMKDTEKITQKLMLGGRGGGLSLKSATQGKGGQSQSLARGPIKAGAALRRGGDNLRALGRQVGAGVSTMASKFGSNAAARQAAGSLRQTGPGTFQASSSSIRSAGKLSLAARANSFASAIRDKYGPR